MAAYRAAIPDRLAQHGPMTGAELRKAGEVPPREVNAHSWALVRLGGGTTGEGVITRLADGRYALAGTPHETVRPQTQRQAVAIPLPLRIEGVNVENSQIKGIAIGTREAMRNVIPDEVFDEIVEEVIERFDRSLVVLRDDRQVMWTMLALGEAFGAVHMLNAEQVDLCRKAAERKHDYYEPRDAEVARARYDRLYDRETEIILRWWSKAAHKAWITRGENALRRRRKLFTHFFELKYEFAGERHQDGGLCVSEAQAKQALARAKRRIRSSLIGAQIISAQVAPFAKARVRVPAGRSA